MGPELAAICRPVLYGDPAALNMHMRACGIDIAFDIGVTLNEFDWDKSAPKLCVRNQFGSAPFKLGAVNAQNGLASLDSASAAIKAALDRQVAAVVAAPQNQKAIASAGVEFDGYPSFVAGETGLAPEDVFRMPGFDDMRIAHCTLHSCVRSSIELITYDRVRGVIRAVDDTLIRMTGARPKIVVGGLNPHAGENGLFGEEDGEIIAPAIADACSDGIDVEGPVGADTMLERKGVDAFVVMLHDQGHIPAKVLAPRRTAGLSIGSPILFSSVAHGSGHDIAGQNKGDPTAIVEAVKRLVGAA